MARLIRRGIGKFYRDRLINKEESLQQSIEGLECAYEQLWADAEKCIGDYENSWFWALMFKVTAGLMTPMTRDMARAMERSIASAMERSIASAAMLWNAGRISAGEMGKCAYGEFLNWFYEEFIPEHNARCAQTDETLLYELNGFIKSAMERDGVHPVELKYLCTDDYYRALRRVMEEELLPTVEVKINALVPVEIRDTPIPMLRRRRLRRGLDSLYGMKKEARCDMAGFINDVLITEKMELDHANCVLHALARSIVSEALYLLR